MGATVGAALGVGVALGMVFLMAQALSTMGLNITYAFRLQSLIVGFSLGILLTFLVVSVSAWRVSLLNIVTAIRDLPEPALRKGRRVLVFGILALVIGLLMALSGLSSKQATPFHMGVSLIAISLVPLLLRARVPDRIAFTVPGVLLVVWWLLPFDALDAILPELSSDMSIFIISGIMLIVGSTWVVMYNSDLLIRGVMRAFGRFRNVAPGLRIAISYPMAYRFRTGMTLAMFSLVVFTLVVMATLTGSFDGALDDLDTFGGGFDVLATTIPVNPVNDMEAALAESTILSPGDLELVASQSISSAEARQIGVEGKSFESYLVRGLDDAFLGNTTYQFATTAEGYESDRDVWQALAENPGLAVIDPFTVPRRENLGFMLGAPDFQLEGFFLEDENFAPVDVEVINPQTGEGDILTIIGVFRDTVPFFMIGMSTSQAWVEASFGLHTAPTVHFLKTSSNVDAEFVARSMESAFLANGMEAESLEDELNEALSTSRTFNYIIQGFMGLGLVVGVAALGVISARSVVERRQEIGVLRAIGFQGRMVQFSFLLESSFIALLSIAVGVTLGLILSWNIIQDTAETSSWENLSFIVPWVNLLIIFGLTYISALLMTFLPARQASRVYPAEALRYE
ncbi:MAG: ABC transporter permease [Chloroflexi bacterium]|nr:ABC transporter permease [Chloroflexota bacterium]